MAQTLGMRATSLAASAALLGLAGLAALTMKIVHQQIAIEGAAPIGTFVEEPPEPPPLPASPREPVTPIGDPVLAPIDVPPLMPTLPQQTTTLPTYTYAPPSIVDPTWVRRPRDLARYFPARALERGVEGRVVLDCAVSVRGMLACAVVSETPASWGFAEAALRISRDYQMVPATRDGEPIEARHRMVVPFRLD